jgi:hypothetical protein
MLKSKIQRKLDSEEKNGKFISGFKELVNYKRFKHGEFTDYSRFLLDLKYQKIRGKETFTFQEFKPYVKTDNLARSKRDAFLSQPYNRKMIDDYLIKSYAIALLEYNENPVDVRTKEVAKVAIEYEDPVYNKKRTYDKVVGTTYINSLALKMYPYMELCRVRVLNYLKIVLNRDFGLKSDSEIRFGIDINDTRYEVIEYIFNSIPTYYTKEKNQILDLIANFITYFYSQRTFEYTDRSKNRSPKYKQGKLSFEGNYLAFLKHMSNPNFSSNEINILNNYFILKKTEILKCFDYDKEVSSKTAYKRFKRKITELLVEDKLKNNDLNYINKEAKVSFNFNDFKVIKK